MPQPVQSARPQVAATANQPVHVAQLQPTAAPAFFPAAAQKPQTNRSWESWVGRNLIGIIASVLVFVGLIFLGVLVVPRMPDELKILSMFVLSAAFVVPGFILTKKIKNSFTQILLGTGCGAFFISILLTHLFFHAIGDIPAFALLLAWMAASLFVAKTTQSVLVSIIAHVGMIISICYSFIGGMSDERVLLLLAYQVAATVVIIVGNILCSKKTYRFGLFASLALTVVASGSMWICFWGVSGAGFDSSLPSALIAGAFIFQFVAASFLSYLLFVSTVRVAGTVAQVALHLCNKFIWLGAVFSNVYLLGAKLYFVVVPPTTVFLDSVSYGAVLCAVVPTLVVLLAHSGFTVFLRKKLAFKPLLEMLTVGLLGLVATGVLGINFSLVWVYQVQTPAELYLVLIALGLLLVFLATRERFYQLCAAILIGLDLLYMLAFGFEELTYFGTIASSFAYLAACLGLLFVLYLKQDEHTRERLSDGFKLTFLVIFELGLTSILLGSELTYALPVLLLSLIATLLLVHFSRFERAARNMRLMTLFLRVNEFAVIYIGAGFIAFGQHDVAQTVLYLVLATLSLLVLALRFAATAKEVGGSTGGSGFIELFSGLGFTLLVLAVIQGNTAWFDEPYLLSLVAMLTALAVVVLGFWSRIKVLRLYGLVVMLVSIIKLVTFDISGADATMRIVAFIGGGLICFAISALYNFAVKRLR
jgi:hypothetical protein